MKSKTILLAAVAIFAASCSNLEVNKPVGENDSRTVDVRFSIWDYATKAPATADEKKVNSLQMFVFKKDGTIEVKSDFLRDVSSVNLNCTEGEKKVVAVVNAPSLGAINSYSDFNSLYSNLSENAKNSLVMVGDTTVTVSFSNPESVAVKVKRLGVRVAIKRINNKLANKSSIVLKKVYLINAAGNRTYFGDSAPTVWYNQRKDAGDLTNLLNFGVSSSTTIAFNSIWDFSLHHAYCYPNPVETDTSEKGEWKDRYTRAVVEATIDGKTYYYPVSLPGLKANTAYDLSLVITRLGSDDPDIPISTEEMTYSLEVVDWNDGVQFNETI